MKKLSTAKLAKTLKKRREDKGLTQEGLSKKTGVNRVMIGRIENENYIPSIRQMESLAKVLEFQITDMFVEKNESNSFIALRSEALDGNEKAGIDKLFNMMLSLRQQIILRSKFENETVKFS